MAQMQKAITILEGMHADLLLSVAKVEKVPEDDTEAVRTLMSSLSNMNEQAEHHVDAGKLLRNKCKNFLQSQ